MAVFIVFPMLQLDSLLICGSSQLASMPSRSANDRATHQMRFRGNIPDAMAFAASPVSATKTPVIRPFSGRNPAQGLPQGLRLWTLLQLMSTWDSPAGLVKAVPKRKFHRWLVVNNPNGYRISGRQSSGNFEVHANGGTGIDDETLPLELAQSSAPTISPSHTCTSVHCNSSQIRGTRTPGKPTLE